MTINELIEELEGHRESMGGDTDVHFSYNYGDRWRTTVAPKIENIEQGEVTHSDYHDMDKVIDVDDEQDGDLETRSVLILS